VQLVERVDGLCDGALDIRECENGELAEPVGPVLGQLRAVFVDAAGEPAGLGVVAERQVLLSLTEEGAARLARLRTQQRATSPRLRRLHAG
jgi:hypothetical protein